MTELPYVSVLSNIQKYFDKIKKAETPQEKFSQDFMKNILGFKSGNDFRLIPLLKAMKFIDESGNPLQLYREFRSERDYPSKSLALGLKNAYSALYSRDKDIHNSEESEIKGHVVALTDKEENSSVVRLITQTFVIIAKLSDFKSSVVENTTKPDLDIKNEDNKKPSFGFQMPLTHTIVLNLPTTTTKEVYDTIFTSLRENLLEK